MFKFIKIILFIGIVTILSLLATENPGTVIIDWLDLEIRSTVPVFIINLLVILFVFKIFILTPLRIINKIFSAPKKFAKKRKKEAKKQKEIEDKETVSLIEENVAKEEPLEHKKSKSDSKSECLEILPAGFIALQTNDALLLGECCKKAESSKALKNSVFLKLLQAFYLELKGKKDDAKKIFEELHNVKDNQEVAFLASQKVIDYAIEGKNQEKAFLIAKKLYEQRNDVKWIIEIYFDLLIEKKLWKDALTVIDNSLSKKILAEEKYKRFKAAIFFQLARKEKDAGDLEAAMKYAITANESDHSFDPAAILLSSFYAERGMDKKAAGVLSRSWRIRPIPDVAHAYVKIWKDENIFEQVQRVEQLALAKNKHPLNDVMIAEYNIKAGLWGPVKKHLDNYMTRFPTTKKVAKMMAEFEEGGNKDYEAAKEWRGEAENAEPDPMWICSKCHGQFKQWHSFCSYCGAFASIEWTTPGRTLSQEIEFEQAGMKK